MAKKAYKAAWYCPTCGRIEAPKTQRYCPICDEKMQRSSRFEWFLIDEIQNILNILDVPYTLIPQYPIEDHRGFTWYWDIYLSVDGCEWPTDLLIDIQGPSHKNQKEYSGPGGGYTRDDDKHWEAFGNLRLHKQGVEVIYVLNDECRRKNGAVKLTALEIVGIFL